MVAWVEEPAAGLVLTFIAVWGYFAIHEVNRELEDPFLHGPNDLPLPTLQADLNNRLHSLDAPGRGNRLAALKREFADSVQSSVVRRQQRQQQVRQQQQPPPPPQQTQQMQQQRQQPSNASGTSAAAAVAATPAAAALTSVFASKSGSGSGSISGGDASNSEASTRTGGLGGNGNDSSRGLDSTRHI